MKKLTMSALLVLIVSGECFGAGKSWLAKCGNAPADAQVVAAALKSKGVNILSTASDQGRFRDDLCGSSGALLAFYLRNSDVSRAKDADPGLKSAPEGFPPAGRKTH